MSDFSLFRAGHTSQCLVNVDICDEQPNVREFWFGAVRSRSALRVQPTTIYNRKDKLLQERLELTKGVQDRLLQRRFESVEGVKAATLFGGDVRIELIPPENNPSLIHKLWLKVQPEILAILGDLMNRGPDEMQAVEREVKHFAPLSQEAEKKAP